MANEKDFTRRTKTITGEDLSAYYNDLQNCKPLESDEEKALLREYRENNDLAARQKLITSNLRYAFSLVNKYKNRGVPLADLLEEANIGLIESIDKFDIKRDVKVITYARWNMEYKICEAIKEHDKLPESDLPEESDIQFGEEATLSDEYDNDAYVNEAFLSEDDEVSRLNAVNDVDAIITVLDDRETDIIKMYYGISPYETECTYEEIGKKYDITKERVRQIIDKIMRKLRVQALTILKQ
jgi:RNA polymerase primary sigma factor